MSTVQNRILNDVDPDLIDKNPVNPRLIFREAEMNQLLESIHEVGIQVPLSVFERDNRFVLLDGERRWRCARKLNLATVPVLIQPEPTPLENLLTMFNIHNVRSDWDLMPMALKLRDVRDLLDVKRQDSSPKALSGVTGVTLPTIRRALELLELPQHYQDMLLKEAEKPRDQQTITADVFVEVNKSKRVIQSYQPDVFKDVTGEEFVDAMVNKYRSGVVNNVVRFRDISKIARAERAGGDTRTALPTLLRLVKDPNYRIEDAYRHSVESAYLARDVNSRVAALQERLLELDSLTPLPDDLRHALEKLSGTIGKLLRR